MMCALVHTLVCAISKLISRNKCFVVDIVLCGDCDGIDLFRWPVIAKHNKTTNIVTMFISKRYCIA